MIRALAMLSGLVFWCLPAVVASAAPPLPPIALEPELDVLTHADRALLGMPSLAWSDSTVSLVTIGTEEILYGTGADNGSERCNGLVGFPVAGIDDIWHSATLPRFGKIAPAVYVNGCLAASPHSEAVSRYRTPACQADPTCADATPFDNDYTAMTSTVHLPNGLVVAFVHGEHQFWDGHGNQLGDKGGFYGRIGLYVSRDQGRSFQRFSSRPVIQGNVSFETVYGQGPDGAFDSSGGAAIVRPDGMVYVYYSDEYDPLPAGDPDQAVAAACGVCIAVAAIPLAELAEAIANGAMPQLKKFYRGGFTQPAIGGRFTPVVEPDRAVYAHSTIDENWIVWPSVGRSVRTGLYVMAYMSQWGGTRIRTSADGLTGWSEGMFISLRRVGDMPGLPIPAIPYPSIIAGGADHHDIAAEDFYLYYQSSDWPGGYYDWPNSRLVRRRVSLAPGLYRGFVGYFSYTGGFIGYSNGQGHWCSIATPAAFARLYPDPTLAYRAAHLEPAEIGWTLDGACLG